ncbi:MAG: hypothetical protein L3K08_08895, partial [Thermoplasmata archaeon]|nr:hypothetical protein [Thermoplasmata archaeon]
MAIGVLFVAVLHGMLASPVLWQRYGAGPQRVVVGVAVLTTGISIPLGWVAADLSAAGEWPFGALNVAGISGVGAAVVVIGA